MALALVVFWVSFGPKDSFLSGSLSGRRSFVGKKVLKLLLLRRVRREDDMARKFMGLRRVELSVLTNKFRKEARDAIIIAKHKISALLL